jgi:glyoxylase-like metal-dependent hydrolase (beta-lactamase superfamily II)
MKRGIVLGALLAVGALSLGAAAYQQQPPGPKVVEVEKVRDNLYMLKGNGGGGNTAVLVAADGVVVVDAKNPGWGQPILDKIKELTPKPVTILINTHTHGDHVSGNVDFPATVDIVVQDNTKANMERMDIFKQSNGKGLPKKTFKDKMTLGKGADRVDLYYFGPGHTNGDAWVVFPALRAAHVGDLFASKSLPLVDGDNGGSVLQYPDTLIKGYNGIKNVDTVINGHTATTTTWADLKEFAEFNKDFLTWAQAELKAGKTPDQAAGEWKVPEKYQGYSSTVPPLFGGLPGRLQRLAAEMKK